MSEEATAQRETFAHEIEVDLSEADQAARKDELVKVDRRIAEVTGNRAIAKNKHSEELQEFKKDLTNLGNAQVALLQSITTKKAKVEVQCYQERDDRRGMMLTRRIDTGEIVDERALTAEERKVVDDRQGNLFEGDAAAVAGAPDNDDEPEERGDEDTEEALAEYAAQNAAAGESNTSTGGDVDHDHDDSDDDDESDLDDDSEGAPAH